MASGQVMCTVAGMGEHHAWRGQPDYKKVCLCRASKRVVDSTEAREFWNTFDVEQARLRCECPDCEQNGKFVESKSKYDGRCRFAELQSYGAIQGVFRCVPAVHPQDFRMPYHLKDCNKEYKKGGSYGIQTKYGRFCDLDVGCPDLCMTQTSAIKWQKAVQPNMGGADGLLIASQISGRETFKQDAYKRTGECLSAVHQGHRRHHSLRTGDICLKYQNGDDKLPPTKIRCLSQQFRWGVDGTALVNWCAPLTVL